MNATVHREPRDHVVSAAITRQEFEQLERLAARGMRSRSQELRVAIARHLVARRQTETEEP